MRLTIVRRDVGVIEGLPQELHPVLRRVYAARGLDDSERLSRALKKLHKYQILTGIEPAAERLVKALAEQQRIVIVADFDADGATSCVLGLLGLRRMGAARVDYLVPNRFEYGYGLTPEIVEVAAQQRPDLIITVDNGISSIAGVAAARARGISVVVTDHHLPGALLPAADAIVNPNLPGCDFPSKHLAGVGVMLYVLMALRARLRETGWFTQKKMPVPNLAELLDLVALGTVADVVSLDDNNRLLVAQGLARIRAGRCRPGIRALLELGGRDHKSIAASDLGFAVAPRLNAAGRLEDMALGIECLLTDSEDEARRMAFRLDALNRERREIEQQMQDQAWACLHELRLQEDKDLPVGLCLYDERWHQGVVGILASRIKDRLHRPVIAFARDGETGMLKGSARSVPGLHIRDALANVATRAPKLIAKFGGHAMAAGLSLPADHFDDFSQAFADEAGRHLSADDLRGVVYTDGPLEAEDLNLELAQILRDGGPWGQDFAEPLFDGEFQLLGKRVIGERHLRLKLRHPDGRAPVEAVAFNTSDHTWPQHCRKIQAAYRLDVNRYNGEQRLHLVMEQVWPVG